MKKAIAAAWATRLRAGGYKQGHGALKVSHNDGKSWEYCCLGVLCEMAVEAGVAVQRRGNDSMRFGMTFGAPGAKYGSDETSSGYLPEVVRVWAGMMSPSGHLRDRFAAKGPYTNEKRGLASRNDGGETFDAIADTIAKHPDWF
jgi:hypothetical protein